MTLSVLPLLERIWPVSQTDQNGDWFAQGVAAHENQLYLKALETWRRSSARGHLESSYRIGLLYARGEGVVQSLPDAAIWYRHAAEAGHPEAQFQLGLIYLHGANAEAGGLDHWFEAALQRNSEVARQTLSLLFPNGIKIEKDPEEAGRWIWSAASAGNVEAQAVLGEMYRHGLGVTEDYQEALRWYWLAAQQGIAAAQFAMGDLYYQGLGVTVDHCLAADWYEKAAKNGDARAQVALGSICRTGQGKPADLKEAGRLFVQAAEQGEARGLYHAALMHLKGEGLPRNIDKAETYLRRSAKQNYLPAIVSLAQFYAHGNGIEPDLREAAVWYLKAAELGDVQSQFIIGRLYATGAGVPSNLRESARWFLRAAEQGNPTAAHNVATYYAGGIGLERDLAKAVEWYQTAAATGLTASQVQLGKMYLVGDGVPRDHKLAADWLEKAVQSSDPEAKTALATLHLQDNGAAHDPSRAEELLKQAAEGGHAAAAKQLGDLYFGKYAAGAKPNEAVHWYTRAAEGGATEAQHTLGVLYLNGRGVQKNLSAAAHWIEKAAQGAHPPSQFQLAVLYCTGQGVPKDLEQAVTWYEQAAEQGHAIAQYNLAVMMSKGQGCEVDEDRAGSWFEKAAEQGVAQAKGALADLHRAGRYRPSDDNTAVGSLSRDQEPSPPASTTQQRANLPTTPPSSRLDQKDPNAALPYHSMGTSGATTSVSGGPQMDNPSKRARAWPQGAAHASHAQTSVESAAEKTDDDRPQNDDWAARRGADILAVRALATLTEAPSRDRSDQSAAGQEASNPAVLRIPHSARPELNPHADQSQKEPSPVVAPPMPNSSQVEQSAPESEDHSDASRAVSKQVVDRETPESSPPHRTVEREIPQSKKNLDRLERRSSSPGSAWAAAAPPNEAEPGLETQPPPAIHSYARPTTGTPDATTLVATSGLDATTDASKSAIMRPSLDEIEGTTSASHPRNEAMRSTPAERSPGPSRSPPVVDSTDRYVTQKPSDGLAPSMDAVSGGSPGVGTDHHPRISVTYQVMSTLRAKAIQRPSVRQAALEPVEPMLAAQYVDGARREIEGDQGMERTLKASSRLRKAKPSEQTERHSSDTSLPERPIEVPEAGEPDDVSAQEFSSRTTQDRLGLGARSVNDEAFGHTPPKRHDSEDHDALAKAMSEIGKVLQTPEHPDRDMARGLMGDHLETDPADHHQNKPGQPTTNASKLRDRLATAVIRRNSVSPPTTKDDTAFRDLAHAMAELGIVSPKSETSQNALRDHPTGPSDVVRQNTFAPNSEQSRPKATGLSADSQAHNIPSELANSSLAEPGTTAPRSPTAGTGRQQTLRRATDDGSRPGADQIAPHTMPSTDAEKSQGEEPSAKLNQNVGELHADPIASLSRIDPPPTPMTGQEPLTTKPERKSTTNGRIPSGAGDPPSGQAPLGPKIQLDSPRSPAQAKISDGVDWFLADLTRQLDDIELLSHHRPKN
jgi:uncharacterized protein